MKFVLALLFSVLLIQTSTAQQEVSFSADQLKEMAQRYAGNSLNWPVLVSVADHNISENKFTLSSADIIRLNALSRVSLRFEEQEERVNGLIAQGASIFAREQLNTVNQTISSYLAAIRDGDLDEAVNLGTALVGMVDTLEQTIQSNRLVAVQAQLTAKDGEVDKRKGLLADWQEAIIGDLFEESDGVKTAEKSYATVAFTDGSSIIINPQTTAVIRKSRIDKLDETSDTEITLVEGGLLSKLSAAGKERSTYILNAGSSTTELNSQNFYAENPGNNDVKLTNYDGSAQVSANNVIVTIGKNEGTIVRNNAPPIAPVKLLDAPEYLTQRKDTIIYTNSYVLNFKTVPNAVAYNIEYSTSYGFNQNVTKVETRNNRLQLNNLPMGITYIKVQSIDNLGLKGPFSEVMRVIRNEDTKAPPIFGSAFEGNIFFTSTKTVTLEGTTEPDAKVTVDGKAINVSASGSFSTIVQIASNDETVEIKATDNSKNTTTKRLRIAELNENYLFNIKLNGSKISSTIRPSTSPVTITGLAYPEMEVELKNEDNVKIVKTDSQGRWGVTMSVQQGKLSVTFKTNQKDTATLNKIYTVQ